MTRLQDKIRIQVKDQINKASTLEAAGQHKEASVLRKSARHLAALWGILDDTLLQDLGTDETLMVSNDNISPMVDRIYTPEEAAEALKIKPRTLRQWVSDGKIKAFKMGDRGLIRIHEEDLQAFIDQERERSRTRGKSR